MGWGEPSKPLYRRTPIWGSPQGRPQRVERLDEFWQAFIAAYGSGVNWQSSRGALVQRLKSL